MIDMRMKKALTRFEGKSIYLFMCIPFVCIVFSILYLFAAARIGDYIDLNVFEIIKMWINGPEYDEQYSGILIKALNCVANAFLQIGLALCSGLFVWSVSKTRMMYREIVLILERHNEWPDV